MVHASHLFKFLLSLSTLINPIAYAYEEVSDQTLQSLPGPENDFDIHNGLLLAPILRPRVPGTPASLEVLQHFVDFFKNHLPEWRVQLQNSTSKTPATGDELIPFVNFIASRDPPWASYGDVGRLTLVAHYDSLRIPEGFIGAIDSAAPCAMLMHVARSIDQALTKKWKAMEEDGRAMAGLEDEQGVQILLLDGEEAFVSWTATDSCYGARSLAEAWDTEVHPAQSIYRTPLSSISLFVLLDLLGAKNSPVPSYFLTSHWAYQAMAKLETRLRSLGQFETSPNYPSKDSPSNVARSEDLFLPQADKPDKDFRPSGIGDDHEAFMKRGVDILHLIPSPFPHVWHTIDDDGEHLDPGTVKDWATLVTAFAAEWMELDGYFHSSNKVQRETQDIDQESNNGSKDEL